MGAFAGAVYRPAQDYVLQPSLQCVTGRSIIQIVAIS